SPKKKELIINLTAYFKKLNSQQLLLAFNMIKKFTKNPYGRDIAVGDIHGNYPGLMAALDSIGFSVQHDRLFSVGDIVDRGMENELCVQLLDRPWFHAVCGNHEDMAITHVKIAKVSAE